MKTFSRLPGIELACALKPLRSCWRDGGIMEQIALAFAFGQHDCLFGNKERVVALAVESNFWAFEAYGHGNKAAKRAAEIETAAWFDSRRLTEQDVDALAERYTEGRTFMSRRHAASHS